MKNTFALLILFVSLAFFSCKNDRDKSPSPSFTLDKLEGAVQKGPYLNGTSITMSELTNEITPTGKSFSTQIINNKGLFEINNVQTISEFIQLRADGFYYNEVENKNSTAQLTLYALSDLTDKTSLNVNILTHLEQSRVKNLVSKNVSFTDAKKQAQREILAIFNIEKPDNSEFEILDISQLGDDNAILLAISIIFQGHLSISDLSELLANVNTDISNDGILNDREISTTLINNAKSLNLVNVRQNLEAKYASLGATATIPDFEKYVNQFLAKSNFELTYGIKYPNDGKYGENILDSSKTDYSIGAYSMKAIIPKGSSLKVIISSTHRNWSFPAFQHNTGWENSSSTLEENSRIFQSIQTGEIDFQINWGTPSSVTSEPSITISVYENNDNTPTWSKTIRLKENN